MENILNNNETEYTLNIMVGKTLFQISASGNYKHLDGKTKNYSKNIYINKLTNDDIDDF